MKHTFVAVRKIVITYVAVIIFLLYSIFWKEESTKETINLVNKEISKIY